jgi:hypothetical protein
MVQHLAVFLPKTEFSILQQLYLITIECIQTVIYYENLKLSNEFRSSFIAWHATTLNAYQQTILIKWSNLFNLHGKEDQTNFKILQKPFGARLKQIGIADPDKDLLKFVLQHANMTESQYDDLLENLKNYRDKFVSHRDIKYLTSANNKLNHPYIRPIGIVSWGLFRILKDLLNTYPTKPDATNYECLKYINYDDFNDFENMISQTIPSFSFGQNLITK